MSLLGGRFGTVDKAAFMVGKKQKDDGSWDFDGPYEVLINPSSLKVSATTQVKKDEGVANEATPETASNDGKITPKGVAEQQIDMVLTFNIVEAYNAKTKGVEFKALVTAAKTVVSSLVSSSDLGARLSACLLCLRHRQEAAPGVQGAVQCLRAFFLPLAFIRDHGRYIINPLRP